MPAGRCASRAGAGGNTGSAACDGPRSYNERARLCIACPITNQPKGYPFEVAIHGAQGLSGVVLADQVRCLSWPDQDAQFIAAVPLQVLLDVREKLATVAGID